MCNPSNGCRNITKTPPRLGTPYLRFSVRICIHVHVRSQLPPPLPRTPAEVAALTVGRLCVYSICMQPAAAASVPRLRLGAEKKMPARRREASTIQYYTILYYTILFTIYYLLFTIYYLLFTILYYTRLD